MTKGMGVERWGTSEGDAAKAITAHDDLIVPAMESLNQTNLISSSLKR